MARHDRPEYVRWALRVTGALALLTAATLLHLARQRGVPVWNSLWAEDGSVFVTGALQDFPGTFFAENGGYLHVVPRAIAGVVTLLPVEDAAGGMAVGSAAVIALIATFVYVASSEVLESRTMRLGLAATVLLVPVPGHELLANTTNLHFYLLFACFWALVWQAESAGALAARGLVVVVTALSDPISALFLPLAIVGPVARRSVRALFVAALLLAGLLAQFVVMAGGARPERNWGFRLGALPDVFSFRVTGGLLVGDRFLGDAWAAYGRAFAYGAFLAVAVVIAVLLLHSKRRTIAFALVSLSYAGLFFCVQLVGRGTGGIDPEVHGSRLDAARYVLLPVLLFVATILALVDPRHVRGHPSSVRTWASRVALLWLVVLLGVNYSVTNDRSRGPRWDTELAAAKRACSASPNRSVSVLVAPSPPRVWFARVPCRDV
jgi:hypothetical protein